MSKLNLRKRFDRGMKEFQRQCGPHGVVETYVFRASQGIEMAIQMLAGDEQSRQFLIAIEEYLLAIGDERQWPSGKPMCLACEQTFGSGHFPLVIVLQVPWNVDFKHGEQAMGVVTGVCTKCSGAMTNTEIADKIVAMQGGRPIASGTS